LKTLRPCGEDDYTPGNAETAWVSWPIEDFAAASSQLPTATRQIEEIHVLNQPVKLILPILEWIV
jgi:hypothetical protein